MESMLGKRQRVLIEKVSDKGMAQGYGEHYLPVRFSTADSTKNVFQDIMLDKVNPSDPPFIIASI